MGNPARLGRPGDLSLVWATSSVLSVQWDYREDSVRYRKRSLRLVHSCIQMYFASSFVCTGCTLTCFSSPQSLSTQ